MSPIAALLVIVAAVAGAAPAGGRPPGENERIPLLDPNVADLADASIADARDLLAAPAGTRGWLFVGSDGRFYFQDGSRGRFWGLNVASDSVFQPRAVIDSAIAAIARAGFNLVRLHHVDDENGLLPAALAGTRKRIDPRKLELLDYWIAELKARGIYIYLDLLDYRTFRAEEGVVGGPQLGRGAKPYAVFNERLIELQRDYAAELLFEHTNPFTGLSYAQDPAVCMVELCDENGLFAAEDRLGELAAPYRDELLRRWNYWLVAQYGSRETLARAWTDERGVCALGTGEDPRKATVGLAGVTPGCPASGPRLAGRSMFFAGIHRDYFRTMIGALRSRGLRCPVSAVTKPQVIADLWASAGELDYCATNYYYDHPYYRKGSEWQLPAFLSGQNPLTDMSGSGFAPNVAAVRCRRKPLVVREWNVCWPNEWRGPGMIEAAAYACLQDIDAMILFALDARPQARKLGFFDVRSDPTRWGLAAIGARLYLGGHVRPARRTVAIARSEAEAFSRDGGLLPTPLYQLARVARVENVFCEPECPSLGDLTVLAGRTAATRYAGEQGVISADAPATDAYGHGKATAAALAEYPDPAPPARNMRFSFGGTLYAAGLSRTIDDCTPFPLARITAAADLRPVGINEHGTHCLGVRDMRRRNYVFGTAGDELRLRASLDALGQLFGLAASHAYLDRKCFVSDTDEVTIDQEAGILWVSTPLSQVVAGDLADTDRATAGPLELRAGATMLTCVRQSLDGLDCSRSTHWQVKCVSGARNTGQQVRVHRDKPAERVLALEGPGEAPVVTGGRATPRPLTVLVGGRPVIEAYLRDGCFELCRLGNRARLYCDTAGAKFALPELPTRITATAYGRRGEDIGPLQLTQPFAWPEGTTLLQFPWGHATPAK